MSNHSSWTRNCKSHLPFLASISLGVLCFLAIGCEPTKPPTPTPVPETDNPAAAAGGEGARKQAEKQARKTGPYTLEFQVRVKNSADDEGSEPVEGANGATGEQVVQIKYASWEEILAKVKSSGKPSVVDVWSLACEPCMKEFPGLVALQRKYGDALNCVSVNVNFDGRRTHPPETYSSDVTRFLSFNDAQFDNYICSTANDLVFEALEIPSIPAVILFDADGNEVARFIDAGETRGFSYEKDINAAVADMLGQTTPPAATGSPESSSPESSSPESSSSDNSSTNENQ